MEYFTKGEKRILAIAWNKGTISVEEVRGIYRSRNYTNEILVHLTARGALKLTEFGHYVITEQGKEALNKETEKKITEYAR